jgi:GNAT superfamily N-acetyltransferase
VEDQLVLREIAPPDTDLAYAAMRELRTSLSGSEEFVDHVDLIQRPQGYRLVGVFYGEDVDAVSVAGFRQITNLSWGRHIYVDDLSTIKSKRGQGFAGQLLAWIHDEAVRLGCGQIHLDSGVGPDRRSAHRLYLNHSYEISAHHFVRLV